VFPEPPRVGTGMEAKAAYDSGVLVKAKEPEPLRLLLTPSWLKGVWLGFGIPPGIGLTEGNLDLLNPGWIGNYLNWPEKVIPRKGNQNSRDYLGFNQTKALFWVKGGLGGQGQFLLGKPLGGIGFNFLPRNRGPAGPNKGPREGGKRPLASFPGKGKTG